MATFQEQLTSLVIKLQKQTAEKAINWEWKNKSLKDAVSAELAAQSFYYARYREQGFALFQRRVAMNRFESAMLRSIAQITDRAELAGDGTRLVPVLGVLSHDDSAITYEVVGTPALGDLLTLVKRQASGIDKVLEHLLDDDEENGATK